VFLSVVVFLFILGSRASRLANALLHLIIDSSRYRYRRDVERERRGGG